MINELEGAFSITIQEERQVSKRVLYKTSTHCSPKTLSTVVQELDKTLFESYVRPKAAVLMGIVRGGILDPSMDWYETPQPKGSLSYRVHRFHWLIICSQRYDPMFLRS